jgi:hypothetical protein
LRRTIYSHQLKHGYSLAKDSALPYFVPVSAWEGRLKSIVSVALVAGVWAVAATPIAAQETPPPADGACELHVWPSSPVRSSSQNYFVQRSIVDGAVQGRDGYKKLPENILSTETQQSTLGELDLPAVLKLSDYKVVMHDEPLPSRVIRATKGRLQADSPACYAELVTDDVFYQQAEFDGRHLKAIFRFRQFDGGDVPTRTFGTFVQERLTVFPPETPEQLDAALEEFRLAYRNAVTEFGEALNRPPKKKKK